MLMACFSSFSYLLWILKQGFFKLSKDENVKLMQMFNTIKKNLTDEKLPSVFCLCVGKCNANCYWNAPNDFVLFTSNLRQPDMKMW